ncbi:unnamed protein product [Fraxinus pennsylvanica]|uniref:Cytochrome P450 n=1 Tax=Fraxinus pennsylvanica TaxID=56036 RepID=A0AAD2AGQ0_9LAMI|nr:unnamed protein product [Fraxinus pennsylvanica]
MKDEEGKPLRDIEVLDNITSLLVAGYESTSLAIMWAFHYIAKYPDVLKLHEEHLPNSKKLNGDFITYDEISSCKYTSKVVEKIIRLANISTCVFRTAKKDVHYKGIAPLIGLLLWWWNDIWYAVPVMRRCLASGTKLPPGYMGIPFLGELFSFLWYFKIARHPDDYINSKRRKYGDGVGLYRIHLFGSPSIIVYTPSANKFVLQDANNFSSGWHNEIVGATSLVAMDGDSHIRVRSFVVKVINRPDSLRTITFAIQPE